MVTPGIGDNFNDLLNFRAFILAFLLVLLANFALYLWDVKYAQRQGGTQERTFIFADKGGKLESWLPLAQEKMFYQSENYDLDWLDSNAWGLVKKALGQYAPFFELIAVRIYGVIVNLPILIIALILGFSEGRVIYSEKMIDMEPISATMYHLVYKLGVSLMMVGISAYISFPTGTQIPLLGFSFPVSVDILGKNFWITSPTLWMLAISVIGLFTSYKMSENLPRSI